MERVRRLGHLRKQKPPSSMHRVRRPLGVVVGVVVVVVQKAAMVTPAMHMQLGIVVVLMSAGGSVATHTPKHGETRVSGWLLLNLSRDIDEIRWNEPSENLCSTCACADVAHSSQNRVFNNLVIHSGTLTRGDCATVK
eukprot:5374900-Pyramimonas_sp.AAC.1